MPNFFGNQRFGRRGDNDKLGAAIVRGDNPGVLKLLLGNPNPAIDDKYTINARAAFDRRDNDASMHAWPRRSGMERRVLARLMKTHRPSAAVHAIDDRLRRLWVSALQSRLFNDVVARRIESLDVLHDGDLAYKHDNGACFSVESAAAEQPRCDAFEISPTGPLVGYRMTFPTGESLAVEQEVLAAHGLKAADFRRSGELRVKGARRPLRALPTDVNLESGVDEHGGFITVAFTLPAGSFATVILRELMKKDPAPEEKALEGDDDGIELQATPDDADGEDDGGLETGPSASDDVAAEGDAS